jgi:vancomycin resistance protein VanJ
VTAGGASETPMPAFRTAALRMLAAYPVTIVVLGVAGVLVPIDGGPLALLQILWAHLALAALVLVPVAILVREPVALRVGLAALAVVFAVRMGGEWLSLPAASAAGPADDLVRLDVVTWNVEVGTDPAGTVAALRDQDADLVAPQELTPDVAGAIVADPLLAARWPYRALAPLPGVAGVGLLSRWPLADAVSAIEPVRQAATLEVGGLERDVVNAHPFPARIALPFGFEPTRRNGDLALVRSEVDARIEAGRRVLLIGDFNTAPTEPAFGALTAGLRDAHAEVGLGPGWTWRPSRFEDLGVGLLRLDLVLGGPGVAPVAVSGDCSRAGDHCLVRATIVVEPARP